MRRATQTCFGIGYAGLLFLLFIACAGCGGGNQNISSLSVIPANASIPVGGTQQFSAKATYGDGSTQIISDGVNWASSDVNVASISAVAVATGNAVGTTTIIAAYKGISQVATLSVGVGLTLSSITITPPSPEVAVDSTTQLTAIGTYTDGTQQNITNMVDWEASDASVAAVSNQGLVGGLNAGTCVITASAQGLSGTAFLTVYIPASSLSIRPRSQAMTVSGTTSEPFVVKANGSVNVSNLATLTVYSGGTAITSILCSYNQAAAAGAGQYCSGNGSESAGTYQVVASYPGTTTTATATLTVTE